MRMTITFHGIELAIVGMIGCLGAPPTAGTVPVIRKIASIRCGRADEEAQVIQIVRVKARSKGRGTYGAAGMNAPLRIGVVSAVVPREKPASGFTRIHFEYQTPLFQVTGAGCPASRFPRPGQCREQNGRQDGDDRNHHQQFN